jgi:methylamine dehydrogenase accessory protein MauD
MTAWYFAVVFLFLAVLVLAVAVYVLARQVGILYERIAPMGALMNDSGPKIGDLTPSFNLRNLTGPTLELGSGIGQARLLFFLSPTCPICKKLLPVLKSVRISERDWLQVVLASDGEEERHRRFIETAGLAEFPYVISTELGLAYRVARLPFAVVLDRHGVVRAKGLINSREQLESLFNAHDLGVESVQTYLAKSQG